MNKTRTLYDVALGAAIVWMMIGGACIKKEELPKLPIRVLPADYLEWEDGVPQDTDADTGTEED
jgi:hypothetical protein